MSYTPTIWASDDVITASKMNKIEQGIVDSKRSVFIVNFNYDDSLENYVTDKTFGEICAALMSGKLVILKAIISDSETSNYTEHTDLLTGYGTIYSEGVYIGTIGFFGFDLYTEESETVEGLDDLYCMTMQEGQGDSPIAT